MANAKPMTEKQLENNLSRIVEHYVSLHFAEYDEKVSKDEHYEATKERVVKFLNDRLSEDVPEVFENYS